MLDNRMRTFDTPAGRTRPVVPRPAHTPTPSYASVTARPAITTPAFVSAPVSAPVSASVPAAPATGDPMDLSLVRQNKQARKDHCFQNNLCFRCKQPGHVIANCPLQAHSPNRSQPRLARIETHAASIGGSLNGSGFPASRSPRTPSSRESSPRGRSPHHARRPVSEGRESKKGLSLN